MKNFRLQRMNQITSMGFIGFELAFLKASRVKCNASPSRRLLKTMSCARTVSFSVLNAGKLSCWVHGTVQGGMGTWLLWHSTHNWAVLSFVFTPRAIMPRLSASTMASRHCLNTSDSWQHKHSISVATATPPNPGTLRLMWLHWQLSLCCRFPLHFLQLVLCEFGVKLTGAPLEMKPVLVVVKPH